MHSSHNIFIAGMEAAAYSVSKAKSVTVIGKDDVAFQPVLGREVGACLMELFKEKGVILKMNSGIESFIPSTSDADKVGEVKLIDGSTLAADIVILGIGVTPATKFLDQSGVNLHQNGAIIVDNVSAKVVANFSDSFRYVRKN